MGVAVSATYGKVVGRLIRTMFVPSGSVANGVPIPRAKVVFTASMPLSTTSSEVYIADSVTAYTNDDGYLCSDDGTLGVLLLATNNTALSAKDWTWNVKVMAPSITTQSWSIAVPGNSTIDLATAVKLPPDPGDEIALWQQVLADAEAARDQAQVYANKASDSATQANQYKNSASSSADSAAGYRNSAQTYANNASASQTAAATSATSAATSATNAASSATLASTKALAASDSATSAASSATAVATSASQAATSESNAASSAGLAAGSASNAAGSASTAVTQAGIATDGAATATTQAGIAVQAALDATTAAANALPEWDATTGEYVPASIAAWIKRQRDGRLYGVSIPTGLAVACTKTGDNAGIAVPTPGVIGTPAVDPYAGRGPFFTATVNATVDADGVPHVTAFEGDANFSRTLNDTWVLAPVLFWRWDVSDASVSVLTISDVSRPGFDPQPKAKLPTGELRPYMLYAKYALSIVDGVARSVSGRPIANRNVSHNSLITQTKTATTGYSGKSFADDWYVKAMFLLKYATKNSQSIFAGVTSWNIKTPITVAETGTSRVIIATSQAANIPVGSALMLGSTTNAASGRDAATSYDVFDGLRVIRKEVYDASNTAIYVNAATAFNTTVGTFVQSAPWNTGACDAVVGDGSPTSRTNGREPFTVQGIELGLGMHEVLGDVILKSDGSTGWQIYTNPDSKNEATAANSNYVATGKYNPSVNPGSSSYPLYPDFAGGMLFGTGSGGSTSTGLADIVFYNGGIVAGEREWLSLGNISNGGSAGMWFVSGSGNLGGMWWDIGSRLSAVGRAS